MNNTPDNKPSTVTEKQPSNISLGSLMLSALMMGLVALGATRFEPIVSHPRLAIPLYIFAGIFALIIAASLIYGIRATATDGGDE